MGRLGGVLAGVQVKVNGQASGLEQLVRAGVAGSHRLNFRLALGRIRPCQSFAPTISTAKNVRADNPELTVTLLAGDMAEVDRIITSRLVSQVALIGTIARYIISAGGKRIRPALLLLMGGALGVTDAARHQLAAVVEFIHTATLLHDDVVDESSMRRGRATANAAFGNAASVLVGDFLYSRAFQMMVECGSMRVMQILSEATNVIAEGEVMQLMNMRDTSLDENGYLQVIRAKTAQLFEASARIAAVLAGADGTTEAACAKYGQAIGTAFQVVDDALDYAGDPAQMGKNLGDDLREGKVTLPLIVAMRRGNALELSMIRSAIEGSGTAQPPLADIMAVIHRTGALQATHELAHAECHRAIGALDALPSSPYKDALVQLARKSLTRHS